MLTWWQYMFFQIYSMSFSVHFVNMNVQITYGAICITAYHLLSTRVPFLPLTFRKQVSKFKLNVKKHKSDIWFCSSERTGERPKWQLTNTMVAFQRPQVINMFSCTGNHPLRAILDQMCQQQQRLDVAYKRSHKVWIFFLSIINIKFYCEIFVFIQD